jgi:parallel beta-helix repeat protein
MIHRTGRDMFLALCLGGVLFGASAPAAAQSAEIYPWQNIQQVVNNYPAGTVFYLKAGVHRMQTITPRDGDWFVGEGGTVLSGARQLTNFGRSGAYWYAPGQTQQGTPFGACKPDYPRCGNPEDLFINDVALQHVASLAEVGPGRWFFDYGADRIYFWDDPTNKTVETSVAATAFDGYASGVTISGLLVEKYATPMGEAAVQVGTGWTLENSEVRLNHFTGVETGYNSTVRNSYIHRNGCFGITGAGDDALVEGNEISYNNFAGFNPYWGAGGSKWVYTVRLTVRGNFSHHNGGPGLWTDIANIYTLYENNTVEDNDRGGIFHEVSYDATIRNNTARRNGVPKPFPYWSTGAGIEVMGSSNVEVYGNLVEDNWQAITGTDDHRGDGPYGPYVLRNLSVHDNTIISRLTEPGGGYTGIIDTDKWTAFMVGNNRFQRNQYVLGPKGNYFMWLNMDLTLPEWQSYGHDVSASSGGAQQIKYLSDMSWSWITNGWGPAEKDRSNGEYYGGDGRTLSLDGVTYAKGLGVHSDSYIYYQLHGQCSTFSAVVGLDDEVGNLGSVSFLVYVDGVLRADSGVMTGSTPAKNAVVDVRGANELALIVWNGFDNYNYDHADWADAKVTCQ